MASSLHPQPQFQTPLPLSEEDRADVAPPDGSLEDKCFRCGPYTLKNLILISTPTTVSTMMHEISRRGRSPALTGRTAVLHSKRVNYMAR